MRIGLLRGFVRRLLLVGAAGSVPAGAQDAAGPPGGDLAERVPPPAPNDRVFVIDTGPGLDTGCTYRSGGPLVISLPVTRYLGPTTANGTLARAADLVQNGLIGPYATLKMAAWDVDYSCSASPPTQCERDRVYFNGERVDRLHSENNQYLTGVNEQWASNSFKIPIEKIRFPAARGANGNAPAPALNEIRIEIDVANTTEVWCTAIDWVALEIQCMSPIILIHGNGSDGGFFQRQGFTTGLDNQFLLWDNSIDLNPPAERHSNAQRLDALLPPLVASFGVDSVHVVAHSKGGLDFRDYLQHYQPAHDAQFAVLSFTTLSTPHEGSVLADISMAYRAALNQGALTNLSAYPSLVGWLAWLLDPPDAGRSSLQTFRCAAFNVTNMPSLPRSVVYSAVGADADINGNGWIDYVPDEFLELRWESTPLAHLYAASAARAARFVHTMWLTLRTTSRVAVNYVTAGELTAATVGGVWLSAPLHNDTLVTVPSALGASSLGPLLGNTATYIGANGRNHSSIASWGVAMTVGPWIIQVETSNGDLK